jgi:hypothetical protein
MQEGEEAGMQEGSAIAQKVGGEFGEVAGG